jgi:hypothetical protein
LRSTVGGVGLVLRCRCSETVSGRCRCRNRNPNCNRLSRMFDNDHDYDNDNELPRDFCTDPLVPRCRCSKTVSGRYRCRCRCHNRLSRMLDNDYDYDNDNDNELPRDFCTDPLVARSGLPRWSYPSACRSPLAGDMPATRQGSTTGKPSKCQGRFVGLLQLLCTMQKKQIFTFIFNILPKFQRMDLDALPHG